MKRCLIAAGGTGGHFYPGLRLALDLRGKGWEVLFIVKQGDIARPRLDELEFPYLEVPLTGLPRKFGAPLFMFALQLYRSVALLSRCVRDYAPNVVVGMGGYLTFPAALAAWRRSVPCAVHEANALLGLANTAAARFGAKLFWGLPPKTGTGTVVGTPVRAELVSQAAPLQARATLGLDINLKTILVFGGSQGASKFNDLLPMLMSPWKGKVQILHIAGRGKLEETRASYARSGVSAKVVEYMEEMFLAYAASDLVICRSGASTLAELVAQRRPAILIPYPLATAHHQDANAEVLTRVGASVHISEADMSDELPRAIDDLLFGADSQLKREHMTAAYESLGLPAAELGVARFVEELEAMAA